MARPAGSYARRSARAMMHAMTSGLTRRFGLLEATALNMSNMIGIGPFITIPLLMSALNGPLSMLGWLLAVAVVIPDGMVWAELGAAFPGSGGSYRYLREGLAAHRWGRLAAFLFIWQFILSGPLEIASGYIGLAAYLGYLFPSLTDAPLRTAAIAVAAGLLNLALLYRPIHSIGKITVALWAGTLLTTLAVIAAGITHFDAHRAFDLGPNRPELSLGFFLGLGAAARIGIYDYLGYYDICFIGDEVKSPGRVIPRSILISVAAVALLYLAINLSITGVISWREFVPAEATRPTSDFVVSIFMERLYGPKVAAVFTGMVVWTAFGSVFALLLGYSRIPFAAARDGSFFAPFGRLHPTKHFPHLSLAVLGALAIAFSFLSLSLVIDALITTRIVIQFIGQIVALILLRRTRPDLARPYRMALYPLPALLALAGWIFVFATSDPVAIGLGVVTLIAGIAAFAVWSRTRRPARSV